MKRPDRSVFFAAILIVAVVSSVIAGIFLLGPPSEWRLRLLDERRASDLRELSYAIDEYWTRVGMLPVSLDELSWEDEWLPELVDPETGKPYEYRMLSSRTYELCAEFARETDIDGRDVPSQYLWFHGSGRQCFQLEAHDINRVMER